MVGNLEQAVRQAIMYNAGDIGSKILCPLCRSLQHANRELGALDNFFQELNRLMKKPLSFKIPNSLKNTGISRMDVSIEAYKTHSRSVEFLIGKKGAETSDIAMWVSHEYVEPSITTLVEERISFFQAKIESKDDGFKITPRQWYLMRYWPEFVYKGTAYALRSCRRVPDVCSFYFFLFRRKIFRDSFLRLNNICEINSVCMSTPWMERVVPHLRDLDENELLLDRQIGMPLTDFQQGNGLYGLLWLLFLASLGANDLDGISLIKRMFPKFINKDDPSSEKDESERPSIGIKIRFQLKGEGNFEKRGKLT
jgi:hypothetical protein